MNCFLFKSITLGVWNNWFSLLHFQISCLISYAIWFQNYADIIAENLDAECWGRANTNVLFGSRVLVKYFWLGGELWKSAGLSRLLYLFQCEVCKILFYAFGDSFWLFSLKWILISQNSIWKSKSNYEAHKLGSNYLYNKLIFNLSMWSPSLTEGFFYINISIYELIYRL